LRHWEGRDRGLYSGAFGTLGADGSFHWAMTIRSWSHTQGRFSAGCGGAIVIDSDVDAEWQEAWLKIEALQKALERTEEKRRDP
jgi:para-aminobenzoate synthetase component I